MESENKAKAQKQKQKWLRPKLVALVRREDQTKILAGCKDYVRGRYLSGTNNAVHGCSSYYIPPACAAGCLNLCCS